jgi:hypothetical protein
MSGKPGRGCGPRPTVWCTGPDPVRHEQYTQFLRQRAQARFRKEGWEIDFEDFVSIWGGDWSHRGRARDELCMTRQDYNLPWHVSNVVIVPRHEHVRRSWAIKVARGQTGPRHKRITPVIMPNAATLHTS